MVKKIDKRITAKVNMFTQVEEVLTTHPAILEASPALSTMSAHLTAQLSAIQQELQPLLINNTGYAQNKQASRVHLALQMMRVCSALKSFASASSNYAIYQHANYSYSAILKMRATELQEAAKAVHTLAQQHAADLLIYNVDAQALISLDTAITKFETDNPLPRTMVINTKSLRHLVYDKVGNLNDYLRFQVDPVAVTFKLSHPEFFVLYRNARRNYPESIRHEETEATVNLEAAAAFDQAVQDLQQEASMNGVPVA